jgi:nucleoside-diphosphate-sugar epimerase
MILGAGIIGLETYREFKRNNKEVTLASKSKRNQEDYIQIDAMDKDDLIQKTAGYSHLIVTIGLPYNKTIWREQWPKIIDNVISSAITNKLKLIFFDNIYMYGMMSNPMTESHIHKPISHKGVTRKLVADQLHNNMKNTDIMIVRSPDFFGPGAENSVLYTSFLENMLKSKNPNFIGSTNKKHSFAYTKDIAKAIVLLTLQKDTYNQVWHVPCQQVNSINDLLIHFNQSLNMTFQIKSMSPFMSKTLSLFIPILREVHEMRYQFDNDYYLDDSKFRNRFSDFKDTNIKKAIKGTTSFYKSKIVQ